jgi:MFS family permease
MGLVTEKGLTSNAHSLIGAMNGVFQAGALFGIFTAEFVMSKWGRKMGVLYTAILSILGGVFTTASQNVGMFIAFRFLAGAGSGLINVCAWSPLIASWS